MPILMFALVFIVDYLGHGLISFKLMPPKANLVYTDVRSAAANDSTSYPFGASESKGGVVYVHEREQLGDAQRYTFATLTVDIRNRNYVGMKNVTLALLSKSSGQHGAVSYLKDVQYVEIAPFSSGKTSISILLSGTDLGNEAVRRRLENYSLEMNWDRMEQAYDLVDLLGD
ncbi:hypothetical protein [Paenibacillus methanolicus]|uniref:Uncharacterized protein n=1 Tax=Paenibacillus methanolicus TaxID=582686 RepID=A0A5S5BTM8_9BACL|nr:hypothetical protein [Paenibacillus methanolicus]TYP69562.1 hypothetical protein BCM02_11478 [Paenibacillus methanolicus]